MGSCSLSSTHSRSRSVLRTRLLKLEKNKPVEGAVRPDAALQKWAIFESKYSRLEEERDNVSKAKNKLNRMNAFFWCLHWCSEKMDVSGGHLQWLCWHQDIASCGDKQVHVHQIWVFGFDEESLQVTYGAEHSRCLEIIEESKNIARLQKHWHHCNLFERREHCYYWCGE